MTCVIVARTYFRDCFSILGFVRSVIFIKRINVKELPLVSGSHSDEDNVCFIGFKILLRSGDLM